MMVALSTRMPGAETVSVVPAVAVGTMLAPVVPASATDQLIWFLVYLEGRTATEASRLIFLGAFVVRSMFVGTPVMLTTVEVAGRDD